MSMRDDRATDVGDDGDVPRDPLAERLGEGSEASDADVVGGEEEEDSAA
jgi:hypothetical protein